MLDDGNGNDWVEKLSRWPGTAHVVSWPSAIDQLRHEANVSRRLVSQSTWELLQIDATASTEVLTEIVQRRLDAILHE